MDYLKIGKVFKLTSCFLLLASCFLLIPTALPAQELLQVPGVVHVHTNVSSGEYSLDELIGLARSYGIEAIVLTDNHLLKFEYGLSPLRHLLQKRVEMPSVLQAGPERYLSLIELARKRYPEMILITGVEVIPHYYWMGSLYQKNLTMHNGQKNLLVVGFEQPKDYLELPVIGNHNAVYPDRWKSMVYLLPGLLLIPGIWLLRITRKRTVRVGTFLLTMRKSYKWQGSLLILLGLVFLVNNYPYIQNPFTPYQTDLGVRPYQRLIDYANRQGALTFWSMPEAKDYQVIDYGRLGEITVMTNPYPEDLLETQNYTGFGAIYPDNITFTDPGEGWDQILNEYLLGFRYKPPWGFGEIAYHGEEQGKKLIDVETVFLVADKTKEAVLSAMRHGRMYTLHRTEEYGLVLEDFSVFDEGTQKRVFSGDGLESKGQGPITVKITVSTTDGGSRPLTVRLIRSGEVIKVYEGMTPLSISYRDNSFPEKFYYRLDIGKGPHRILSNPIFVRVSKS